MVEKIYYIANSDKLAKAIYKIEMSFPCFVYKEYIEMDYSKITIKARQEDLASIEEILAPLV